MPAASRPSSPTVELMTTFGKLVRGDRVRLSGESAVRKVVAALPYPERAGDAALDVRVSFGPDEATIGGKKQLVWLVLPRG